jgi:hypothetical protein
VTWTAQAEVLADTADIGEDVALIAGRCRATGLDPRSFAPIMGAAMALGSRPWHIMDSPYSTDEELISDVLDAIQTVWDRQGAYIRLRSTIARTRAHAMAMHADAASRTPPSEMDMAYWASIASDCDTALEALASLPTHLRAARANLSRAPAELGETYQQVYDLLEQGRVMPHDGRWISGEDAPACSPT